MMHTLRFTAPEIYDLGSREEVEGAPPVEHDVTALSKFTTESDVWAFAMFVVQVRERYVTFTSPVLIDNDNSDLHRAQAVLPYPT
jgi:hypothetical protein